MTRENRTVNAELQRRGNRPDDPVVAGLQAGEKSDKRAVWHLDAKMEEVNGRGELIVRRVLVERKRIRVGERVIVVDPLVALENVQIGDTNED